jgi:hypothetical protein
VENIVDKRAGKNQPTKTSGSQIGRVKTDTTIILVLTKMGTQKITVFRREIQSSQGKDISQKHYAPMRLHKLLRQKKQVFEL